MRHAALVFRAAALSLVALTLAGCFTSEEELVGYWAADRPIKTGVWAHWPTHPDGRQWARETWRGEIDLERRRYRSKVDDFPHEGVRLKRLSGNIYLAQIPREGGVGYGVAWVYEDGKLLSYHQPDCGALTDAVLETYTLTLDPEGFCAVSDLAQIEAVMGAYLDAVGEAISVDGGYRRVE